MAESMFHLETDASKVAVVALVERLRARGYGLLDIQQQTGATAIFRPALLPRAEYLRRLAGVVDVPREFRGAA
jgi:leucyl/phenylalanyl-tRNA--protein transferase